MSMTTLSNDNLVFESQSFEDLPLDQLGIEELESRVQLASAAPNETVVEIGIEVSW